MSTLQRPFNLDTSKKIVSIYMMAGYPHLKDTVPILMALQDSGADMIEIGMPYSDPLADGPVIQRAATQALENGMNLDLLFEQLQEIKDKICIPLTLMGYFNNVFQFGVEKFCKMASECGIKGLIIPDLPFDIYLKNYRQLFDYHKLAYIPLITPQTSEARIRMFESHTNGFIYAVTSSSTTGNTGVFSEQTIAYFDRLSAMSLNNPIFAGFGISTAEQVHQLHQYFQGVIVGSAFLNALAEPGGISEKVNKFLTKLQ